MSGKRELKTEELKRVSGGKFMSQVIVDNDIKNAVLKDNEIRNDIYKDNAYSTKTDVYLDKSFKNDVESNKLDSILKPQEQNKGFLQSLIDFFRKLFN